MVATPALMVTAATRRAAGDLGPHAVGDPDRVLTATAGEQQHELVAAEAGGHVEALGAGDDRVGDLA